MAAVCSASVTAIDVGDGANAIETGWRSFVALGSLRGTTLQTLYSVTLWRFGLVAVRQRAYLGDFRL